MTIATKTAKPKKVVSKRRKFDNMSVEDVATWMELSLDCADA